MGNTPAQKRQKELRGKNKKRRKIKKPDDPRISEISIGGPLKITNPDGVVEVFSSSPGWERVGFTNHMASPYRKARPRKHR
jgi:hypothetical protein